MVVPTIVLAGILQKPKAIPDRVESTAAENFRDLTFTKPVEEAVAKLELPETERVVLVALVEVELTISRLLMVEVALLTLRLPIRSVRPEAYSLVVVALVEVALTITKLVTVEVALLTKRVPAVSMLLPIVVAAYKTPATKRNESRDKVALFKTVRKFIFKYFIRK